jgi:hypothetical protein
MKRSMINIIIAILVVFILVLMRNYRLTRIHLQTSSKTTKQIIIVNNRVPKCGSSLLFQLFRFLSRQTGAFTFIMSNDYIHYRFSKKERRQLKRKLIQFTNTNHHKPLLYDQHFHFINFNSTTEVVFYYINQLRDPLQRTLSQFDYERYMCIIRPERPACSVLHPSFRNMTIDECISTGDPARCLTKPYGVHSSIAFFCGQLSACDDTITRPTSRDALSLAKSNIERYYLHIGLLEYFDSSLELLEHIQLPLFSGIRSLYLNKWNRTPIYVTPEKYRHRPSNKTRHILRQLLELEYELYEFVQKRFIDHYTRVFQRAPIHHE